MTAAALWPSGLLVFLTPSLTDCLDLIGKDSLGREKAAFFPPNLPRELPKEFERREPAARGCGRLIICYEF